MILDYKWKNSHWNWKAPEWHWLVTLKMTWALWLQLVEGITKLVRVAFNGSLEGLREDVRFLVD